MSLKDKRVLVADDLEINLRLFRALLEGEDASVLDARSAGEALALARRERPDLILMDIQMPDLDGLAATRQLKADPETAHIPVIVVTAAAMKEDAARARAAGCDGFVTKPIDVDLFVEQLERVIGKGQEPR
ncbi:MAG: response regulator [Candidatus Riflebacteria bacterium]|nr:response regulator [Candidatus Riflebacteria bacterium]